MTEFFFKKKVFTSVIFNGEVRKLNHLLNFFKVTGRTEEQINQPPKMLRGYKTFIVRHIC